MFNPDDHKKTARGLLPSFSAIFTGARYADQLYSDRKRGTAHDIRPGEVFVATAQPLPEGIRLRERQILVATPCAEFMRPRFSPRITSRSMTSDGPSSMKIIPWRADNVFLVIATSPSSIGDEWYAFVPLDQSFEVAQ